MTAGQGTTILMVNSVHNPEAQVAESGQKPDWNWVAAPSTWQPKDGPPEDCPQPDLVVVFSRKYAEAEARTLCESIRERNEFQGIPLLVAISMYQMPLGNDVKKLDNADFIFLPIQGEDLSKRMNEMAAV